MGEGGSDPKADHVGGSAKGAAEIVSTAGIGVIERRPLERARLAADGVIDVDNAEAIVTPEPTRGNFGSSRRRADDQAEGAAIEGNIAVVETVGDVGNGVVRHERAGGEGFAPCVDIGDFTGVAQHEGAVAHDDLRRVELASRRAVDGEIDRGSLDDT